jgi:hypothetical protein
MNTLLEQVIEHHEREVQRNLKYIDDWEHMPKYPVMSREQHEAEKIKGLDACNRAIKFHEAAASMLRELQGLSVTESIRRGQVFDA